MLVSILSIFSIISGSGHGLNHWWWKLLIALMTTNSVWICIKWVCIIPLTSFEENCINCLLNLIPDLMCDVRNIIIILLDHMKTWTWRHEHESLSILIYLMTYAVACLNISNLYKSLSHHFHAKPLSQDRLWDSDTSSNSQLSMVFL